LSEIILFDLHIIFIILQPQRGPFPDNFFAPPGFGAPFGNNMHWNTHFGGVNVGFGAFPFGLFGLHFVRNFNHRHYILIFLSFLLLTASW